VTGTAIRPSAELLAGTTLLAILLLAYPLYRAVADRFAFS